MKTSPALVSGVYFLFIFLAYALILRVANFITLSRTESVSLSPFGPPFSLPFVLAEELVIGVVFASILSLLWRHRIPRVVWLFVMGLYLVFLAFEQLAFKLFLTHIDYVLYSSSHDLKRLWSSIEGSFDGFFVMHIILALVSILLLLFRYRPRFIYFLAALVARRRLGSVIVGIGYVALCGVLVYTIDQHGLNQSFPVAFSVSYYRALAEEAEIEKAIQASKKTINPKSPFLSTAQPDESAKTPKLKVDTPKRLNIVWYLMESASLRETSLMPSNPYNTTPFIKALSEESLLFTNYYTGFAASTRSFFSALTGLYPYVDKTADVTKYSRLNVPNLVNILKEAGYETAFFSSSDTLFDSLDTFLTNLKYDHYVDKNLVSKEALRNLPAGAWGVDEEIVIDQALDWIAKVADSGNPFYVSYNAVYPHHPFRLPSRHRDLYNRDWGKDELKSRYRASLYYADMSVKRFYDGLKRLNLLDDTLFIVTSDHGEAFGDLHRKNLIHAEYCYDEDSHIFLLLHNPLRLGPPTTNTRLGSHADLLPTLLNILELDRDFEMAGQSLVSSEYKERMVFCCSRRHLGVRDGNFKFVTLKTGGGRELFDLAADPEEQNDISKSNKEKAAAYEKVVRDWHISVLGAYRERVKKAGLTNKEIQKLATKARSKIFARSRAQISSAAVCLGGTCTSSQGQVPAFSKGQSLAVQVSVRKPGNVGLQVDVFSPGGVRILKHKTPHQNVAKMISTTIPGTTFQAPGRYRVRILLLSSHAVHDSTQRHFIINE